MLSISMWFHLLNTKPMHLCYMTNMLCLNTHTQIYIVMYILYSYLTPPGSKTDVLPAVLVFLKEMRGIGTIV